MEVTGQIHETAALPGSRFPLNVGLGGPQSRPGRFAQKLPLLTSVESCSPQPRFCSECASPFSFGKVIQINSRNLLKRESIV